MVLEYIHMQKQEDLDRDLTPTTKINSKWIIALNVKCKTIKLVGDNIGGNLDNLGYGNDFLDTPPKASSTREKKIDKLELIK